MLFAVLLVLSCADAPAPVAPPTPASPEAPPAPPATPPAPTLPEAFCAGLTGDQREATRQAAWDMLQATEGSSSCAVQGWVTDPDPKGLRLRERPAKDGALLGSLPDQPMVDLVGLKGSWFLVCGARAEAGGAPLPLAGWVHASALATGSRGTEKGYSPLLIEPKEGAAEVGRLPKAGTAAVASCHEGWWKLRLEGVEGWLAPADQCGDKKAGCP